MYISNIHIHVAALQFQWMLTHARNIEWKVENPDKIDFDGKSQLFSIE